MSTTAPLLQNWLSKTSTVSGRDPYFLYALSNAGSLLALLAYPLLIEPTRGIRAQSSYWFAAYTILLILVAAGAALVWTHLSEHARAPRPKRAAGLPGTGRPNWTTCVYWLIAAFVPSGLMLAVTNHMLLNLASVPFLWVMPLALYLITFILCFDGEKRPGQRRRWRSPPPPRTA